SGLDRAVWRGQPAAVLGLAQQGGEAGAGVEARQAQPIDRPVAAHQGGGVTIAEQGIILDARGHDSSSGTGNATTLLIILLPAARSCLERKHPRRRTGAGGEGGVCKPPRP